MSDTPNTPGGGDRGDEPDPFEGMPEELRSLLREFGGPGVFQQMEALFRGASGPVNWDLAGQVARQTAAEGDRPPTEEERQIAVEAHRLAEHWLDEGPLPAPPDAGRLTIASRQDWVNAALEGLAPFVEPVAAAATEALTELASKQLSEEPMLQQLLGGATDLSELLRPLGATLTGMQAGQVLGQLSRQLLGQYELGIPTAEPSQAFHVAVNAHEVFDGYGLDPTEVALVLALQEGALRRQYYAVPWLRGHVQELVTQFAAGTRIDAEELLSMSQDLLGDVDPDDPESLQEAVQRAAEFRFEPTPEQERILARLQGVVCLVQGWTRREVERVAADRLPALPRVTEVLRRRRATHSDGERLLAQLLGLDIKPDDETLGERFVDQVEQARGPEALRQALAHPENLPDTDELADANQWLARLEASDEVPDDLSSLADLGDAPIERSARERFDAAGGQDAGPGDDAAGDEGDEPE